MADRFRRPQQPNDTSSGSSRRDPLEQLRPIGSFFREHPAIVGSLLYLQVTTVGVLYSWQLFSTTSLVLRYAGGHGEPQSQHTRRRAQSFERTFT
jgi:hypothetical protein